MTRIKAWLAGLGAFIAALGAAWFLGRREGAKSADAKHTRRRVEAMQDAKEVKDEVQDMGSDARRDELAKWMRDS